MRRRKVRRKVNNSITPISHGYSPERRRIRGDEWVALDYFSGLDSEETVAISQSGSVGALDLAAQDGGIQRSLHDQPFIQDQLFLPVTVVLVDILLEQIRFG